jgi:glutamate/tyrosine decarboxylase-like PLP-dependent enzyme
MSDALHRWDERADMFAHSVIGYAIERMHLRKDTTWGAVPAHRLTEALDGVICPDGIGGHQALRLFRDVLLPACRPQDDPMNLAYVPAAPSVAAVAFDLVVSASSIFGGTWEAGAGAIAAENQALRWLADLAGFPPEAGGVFVSGGSAANLSALVTARQAHLAKYGRTKRLAVTATSEVHASARAAARVMDIDVVDVDTDSNGRMHASALRAAIDRANDHVVFAVVATGGTTNAGMVDPLDEIAGVCDECDLWLHVDGAYGLAALCAPSVRPAFDGIERADSFGVDPHKWLYAPYDCAALVYRDPRLAAEAHTQHGDYLDAVDHQQWNPADYAYHLSRRVRGLPLWFSLATYGTDAYRDAVEQSLATAHAFARAVDDHPAFDLLIEPTLSVVLFRRRGWEDRQYAEWSATQARAGTVLIVPTSWRGETCMRVCVIDPRTRLDRLVDLLEHMAED